MRRISARMPAVSILCALALLVSIADAVSGERTARFRAGTVISAEISNKKPQILDESPYEKYKEVKGIVWAEIVVKLDKGRSLCAADYILVNNGNEYKCLAIAEDDKTYSVNDWLFDKTNIFGCYRLLFPIQAPQANKGDFELRFKLLASPMPDVPLKMRSMDNLPFTETSKLPPDGALGLSVIDIKGVKKTPAPVPAAPAPAAPAAPAAAAPAATPAAPAPAAPAPAKK